MILLHIEHSVPDYEAWKAAFDSDPVGRQKSGVRRYQVLRSTEKPNVAMIDLEFDNLKQAQALLAAMQQIWNRVGGTLIKDPRWQFAEVVESGAY